jgi:hypothetical protein
MNDDVPPRRSEKKRGPLPTGRLAKAGLRTPRQTVEIPLRKARSQLLALYCGGMILIFLLANIIGPTPLDPLVLLVFGPYFAWLGYHHLRISRSKESGLIIDATGIVENSGAAGAAHISWEEITAYSVTTENETAYLAIHVVDPQRFLQRGDQWTRSRIRRSLQLYGSAIHIVPDTLEIDFEELRQLIVELHLYFAPTSPCALRIQENRLKYGAWPTAAADQ